MKKIKIIPTLLAITLLTGCSFKISVKEPIFVKQGKETTQEEFKTQLIKALEENEFYKAEKDLPSKIMKYRSAGKSEQKRVRKKKTYYSKESASASDSILTYDSKNVILKSEYSYKSQTEVESENENSKNREITKNTLFLHEGADDLQGKVVTFYTDSLTYTVEETLSEGKTAKNYIDNTLGSFYLQIFNSSRLMHYTEIADIENCHFYQNKNVFTVRYKETVSEIQKGEIDGEQVDVMRFEISTDIKSQVDLTNGMETVKIADKQTIVYTSLADYNGYKKGEILEIETVQYTDFSAVDKDATLEKVTDLSKYLAN